MESHVRCTNMRMGCGGDVEIVAESNRIFSTDIQPSHQVHLSIEPDVVIERVKQPVEEEVIKDELGAPEEVEIKPERVPSSGKQNAKTTIPPLRPLRIAPKPASSKQLLVFGGPGPNQLIKLVSSPGQTLKFANVSATTQEDSASHKPQQPDIRILMVKRVDQVKLLPSPSRTSPPKEFQKGKEMELITQEILPQVQHDNTKIIKMLSPEAAAQYRAAGKAATSHIRSPSRVQSTSTANIIFKAETGMLASMAKVNAGLVHRMAVPGKGTQYVKLVSATNPGPLPVFLTQMKPAASQSSGLQNIAPKPVAATDQAFILLNGSQAQADPRVLVPMRDIPVTKQASSPITVTLKANLEATGMKFKKACNCTKSQCLKLYCECFANGEFCNMCNCTRCLNNLENENCRQTAIKTCLEKNPNAFKPKIGKANKVGGDSPIRKHTKGCHCKRSECLKNYCECYEAKIACSNKCKCVECRNVDDSKPKKRTKTNSDDDFSQPLRKKSNQAKDTTKLTKSRHAVDFVTKDVIEATSQCMRTISNRGEALNQDEEVTKRQIIEEFGRCLKEIIDHSMAKN